MSRSTEPTGRPAVAERQGAFAETESAEAGTGAHGPRGEALTFQSDSSSGRPRWIAAGIVLVVLLWMGSGVLLPSADTPGPLTPAEDTRRVTVAAQPSVGEPVTLYFVAEGQALPDRESVIRNESGGDVEAMLVDRGSDVSAGEPLVRLSLPQRVADVARAEEALRRARRELANTEQLLERGVVTADRLSDARVDLATAEAQLATAREAEANSVIRAPFAGRLEDLNVNEGEYVPPGADIGRIVDNTPLTVAFRVPQQALGDIRAGQAAEIEFITGERRTGEVSFVGTSADPATRTFAAEITLANEVGEIPAGISAQIRIPTEEVMAHFVSPAILSLGSDGTLGIKTVDADGRVGFHEVTIVRAETDGIWVQGLPDRVDIIAIGQGFVSAGDVVDPQPMERSLPSALPDGGATAGGVGDDAAEGSE